MKDLRQRIAQIISNYKAYEVPGVGRRYGLADGTEQEAFSSKNTYVSKRLFELSNDRVIEIAKHVAQEEGDAELLRLLGTMEPSASSTPAKPASLVAPPRPYYSERTGKSASGGRLDLNALRLLFKGEYERWTDEGYFQEYFGFWCVDESDIHGKLGANVEGRLLLSLGKSNLWPIQVHVNNYSEDDLFDMIEFMFDHISKPLTGFLHQWNNCGMHWESFDTITGQAEYRETLNVMLARYDLGYELSTRGEIRELGPKGTTNLLTQPLPDKDSDIQRRVDSAIEKFRQRRSTPSDRRDAVRDLADVLEYLRPKLKLVLTKSDEGDLFNIANNFSIRHYNDKQKADYDQAIWLSWMFYFYLATIHACVRLIDKAKS